MAQLGNEHGRHAVDAGAALVLDCLQCRARIERFSRDDHRRPVDRAHERAHDAPKAVIKRHRDAKPVAVDVRQPLADVIGIHQQVAVGQHRPLGEAGGAGGVLNADHIIGAQLRVALRQRSVGDSGPETPKLLPVQHPRPLLILDADDAPQLGTSRRTQLRGPACRKLRAHRHQQIEVMRRLELIGQQERRDVRLVQDILKLVGAVSWVDVDEDGPDAPRRELRDDPLRPIRRPDADVLATLHVKGEQTASHPLYVGVEVAIASPAVEPGEDERVVIAEAIDSVRQHLGECQPINPGRLGVGHSVRAIGRVRGFGPQPDRRRNFPRCISKA